MMSLKKIFGLTLLLVMVGVLLAACQPTEVIKEVIVTQEVEKEVIVTQEVEKEVVVTQEVEKEVVVTVEVEAEMPEEKQVIFALYQEPQILNPYIATQTASGEAYSGIIEGLIETDADGNYYPVLAKEIPTLENGGVTLEGDVLTVTYNLLEGVLWSTGEPFTCDDVVFTWEAVSDPESGAVSTSNFENITGIECPDDVTAVVTYEPFYAPYIETFEAVMPRHATGEPVDMQKWVYNWNPVGTGPFRMQEWVPGDHITLVKNENFRDYPDKPYLDKVVIRITPSREVGMAMIQTGEVDFLWDLIEGVVPDLEGKEGVVLNITPGLGTERLVLNLSDPAVDATDDPLNNPHPLLGDVRVRKALEAAINKDELNEILLFGAATPGTKEYNIGWPSEGCDIPQSAYDPAAAMAYLDDAGFTDEDGDGVRECNGCMYANQGDPLRLKIQTTTGNKLREQAEQLIIEYMAEVGIDMYIENVPSSVLFGSWASGAFRKHGQYDVLMYTTSGGTDPHGQMNGYFGTDRMPTEANSGTGYNYSRWVNPADDKLKAAGLSADINERKALYCDVMKAIADELPHIYLYDRGEIHATREGLTGYYPNPWQYQTWDIGNWDWAP
jgi:peptide/nickel transport system substrate-binding protein